MSVSDSKIALLQWRTAIAVPSGVMSPKFFREKYLPTVDIHNGVHAGKAPDEKLKINELGP